MKPKNTEQEQYEEFQIRHLKAALYSVNQLHKKLSSEVERKKPFKKSHSTIDAWIDSIRLHTDCAHLVTTKERIRRDLKRCSFSLFFWDDKNEYKDMT